MIKKFTFLLCLGMAFIQVAKSQSVVPCMTDELYNQVKLKNPTFQKIEDEANASIEQKLNSVIYNKTGTIRYIPVVFHIIHHNGFENISQAQIMDALRVVNEDYRKKAGTNGASTDPLSADIEVEFRLAQYDANGNKSDGIIRIDNAELDTGATDDTKTLSYWDSNKYLNVWVVSSISSASLGSNGEVLGYAAFPWTRASSPTVDGVIIRSDQIGNIGSADKSQEGRTLTHEIGHWLGLYHTFQGGCTGNTSSNCASQGDHVCDTPPVANSSSGCNVGQNSCTNDSPDLPDMIRDYMDYSDGSCMSTFTAGQKARINSSMSYRTGVFGQSPTFVQDLSYAGLATDGTYLPVAASKYKAPYFYGFEGESPSSSGWVINNFNSPDTGWQVNAVNPFNGKNSFWMRNFIKSTKALNTRDGFQSPEIDITALANPTMEFYYAYAQRFSSGSDSLSVRISNDFGMDETLLFGKGGATLSTTGSLQTTEFIPGPGEWKKVSVDLSPYKTYTHARFRFEFFNRHGNNVFVDDFTIRDGATAVKEELKSAIDFYVAPNPMNEKATLFFTLKEKTNLSFSIVDLLGKEIKLGDHVNYEAGSHELTIDKTMVGSGLYFIHVSTEQSGFSQKLLIY